MLFQCSFHGKIIPRDDEGQPTEQEDIDRLNRERILKEIGLGIRHSECIELRDTCFLYAYLLLIMLAVFTRG